MIFFSKPTGRELVLLGFCGMSAVCGAFPTPPPIPELIFEPPVTNTVKVPAVTTTLVSHTDPIAIDTQLQLATLIADTVAKMPDITWLEALEKEALTLRGRGEGWMAGASQLALRFQEATSGTLHYGDASVQVPLWNIGQRGAEQRVANLAVAQVQAQSDALKLRVAGLVRNALWSIALAELDYEQTRIETETIAHLLATVTRRVNLGDVPQADLLLAQTELLQKQATLTLMEAELMHARKRYLSITQGAKLPQNYQESLAHLKHIQQNHPVLVALNSQISRKQAEIKAATLVGSGQTQLAIGINSDEGDDPRSNKTESFNIGVNIPFGGETHTLQPYLAGLNVELNKLLAERQQVWRDLELAHHEAEHNLEVNRVELRIATDLQRVAQQHLRMMELSHSVGEMNLLDLLKVQTRTQQAVLNAKQRAIILQRDIALYNQAVGIMP